MVKIKEIEEKREEVGRVLHLPLFTTRVSCGFPSPADDYIEKHLSLDEHLVKHPESTFFVKTQGDSMEPVIKEGDLLVIDRSLTPISGKVVLVTLDGEFTVKYLFMKQNEVILRAANIKYKDIVLSREQASDRQFTIFGTVTYVIHKV